MSTKKNHSSLWRQVQKQLRQELPQASYEVWLGRVNLRSSDNGTLRLGVPSGFIKRGLERQYLDLIHECLAEQGGDELEIEIEVQESEQRGDTPAGREDVNLSGNGLGTGLNSAEPTENEGKIPLNLQYTFENFVQGKNNQLATAASQAVAESPGQAYNPLFLYSDVGLGKTHLLHAVGNYLKQHSPNGGRNLVYTSSERFAIDMIQAIRNNKTEEFRSRYRNVDGFLLDDVHFLENKEGTQEELFHTFNELYENGKQIVFTSDRSPDQLSDLQDRLISRFRWGLVADIQPPNFETRVAILRKKANQKGITIGDEILELIASRISTNVRALEGALIKVVARENLSGDSLKPADLEQVLPQSTGINQKNTLTVEAIKRELADHYDLSVQDLEGSSRKQRTARARHIAIYLSRELTDSSFPALGEKFGNRDHSTVMHSHKKIQNMIDETPLFYEEIKEIEEDLLSKYDSPNDSG
ncbi:MAG: chromosomal replication initiator protein DnaA [Candidatus Acetothermia bacterium]